MRLLSEYWDSKWGKPSCFNLIGICAFWESNPRTEDVLWNTWEKFWVFICLFESPLSHAQGKLKEASELTRGQITLSQNSPILGHKKSHFSMSSGVSEQESQFAHWNAQAERAMRRKQMG